MKKENLHKRIKIISTFLLSLIMCCLIGCSSGNGTGTEDANTKLTDVDFIVNLGKGLEKRWALTTSDEYNDDALAAMSLAESRDAYSLFVNAEMESIGDLENYEFEDSELKSLAETYMKGLSLQQEGIQYQGTNESTKYAQTWTLGYNYRAVVMNDLYTNYGLTVSEQYQTNLDDFIAESASAQKKIDLQEFINELPNTIEYSLDEEQSNEWTNYYKAVIENTTDYDIDSLEIDVDFLDASGVVIYQTSDYLQNFNSGTKIQSKIMYDNDSGDFSSMQFNISAYY